jgi:hypothetical protein
MPRHHALWYPHDIHRKHKHIVQHNHHNHTHTRMQYLGSQRVSAVVAVNQAVTVFQVQRDVAWGPMRHGLEPHADAVGSWVCVPVKRKVNLLPWQHLAHCFFVRNRKRARARPRHSQRVRGSNRAPRTNLQLIAHGELRLVLEHIVFARLRPCCVRLVPPQRTHLLVQRGFLRRELGHSR